MISASVLLSIALLAGRLSGLIRELTLASLFGVSGDADVAVLLLTLPDLLVNLLISGGLSAALVPRLTTLVETDACALYRQATIAIVLLFGLVGATLIAFPKMVFGLLAPGLQWPAMASAACVSSVALALVMTGGAGATGSFLNSRNRFFVTGCGTLLFNLGVLAALIQAKHAAEPLTLLAFGIVAGAALRWGAQLATLPKKAWYCRPRELHVDVSLLRAFGAAALASSMMLIAPVIVRALASTLGLGVIASFNYAQKLVELPVAILIVPVSTIALSKLSNLYAHKKWEEAAAAVFRDCQYILFLSIAVAVLGISFADSAVQILFGRGQMGIDALQRVTDLTKVAFLGVPAVGISSMATSALNAQNHSSKVLKATIGSLFFLPLLALPGIVLASELLLMGAVVAFQLVVAAWLARLADISLVGSNGIFNRRSWKTYATVTTTVLCFAALGTAVGGNNHWLRLAIAGTGFGIALAQVRTYTRTRRVAEYI